MYSTGRYGISPASIIRTGVLISGTVGTEIAALHKQQVTVAAVQLRFH